MKRICSSLKASFLVILLIFCTTFRIPAFAIDPITGTVTLEEAMIIAEQLGLPLNETVLGLGGGVVDLDALTLAPQITIPEAEIALETAAASSTAIVVAWVIIALEAAIVLAELGAIAYYTTVAINNGATASDFDYGAAFSHCYSNPCGFWCGIWSCITG